MEWECSECGVMLHARRRPPGCPNCGLAGVFFTKPDGDVVERDGGTFGYWFERGASMTDYVGPASFLASGQRNDGRANA